MFDLGYYLIDYSVDRVEPRVRLRLKENYLSND